MNLDFQILILDWAAQPLLPRAGLADSGSTNPAFNPLRWDSKIKHQKSKIS